MIRCPSARAVLVCAVLAVSTLPIVSTAGERGRGKPVDPALEAVLARFDHTQTSIRTLTARFTWTTRSPLLTEPAVARGHLYLTKPDAIRWEVVSPEAMSFVIADNEYIGYFPARKSAERRAFGGWSEKMFRYFGVGQGSAELSRVYDIELGESDRAGTDLLVLKPRKRRARKRIEELRIRVDRATGLPASLETVSPDGGSREMLLQEIAINPDLAAGVYRVALPPDVEVTQGMAGLGGVMSLAPGPSSH